MKNSGLISFALFSLNFVAGIKTNYWLKFIVNVVKQDMNNIKGHFVKYKAEIVNDNFYISNNRACKKQRILKCNTGIHLQQLFKCECNCVFPTVKIANSDD